MQVTCKIGIDSVFQILGFTNINHSILGISPAINPRASWDFRWLIRNLHENYLVTDFPAADFLAGTGLTALTVLLGGNDLGALADFAASSSKSGFRNLAV